MTFHHRPGLAFTRSAIAIGIAQGSTKAALEYSQTRWGESSQTAWVTKAAVGALATNNTGGSALADRNGDITEFLEAARNQSIIGKLENLRSVPLNVRMIGRSASAASYWLGEAKPAPVSRNTLSETQLEPLKLSSQIITTTELLRDSSLEAEELFRNDLIQSATEVMDRSFIDFDNAGVPDEKPASVTNGLTVQAASGSTTRCE